MAFAFLYEVTILDSRYADRQAEQRETTAAPSPGTRLRFTTTPRLVDRLFRLREAAQPPPTAVPVTAPVPPPAQVAKEPGG